MTNTPKRSRNLVKLAGRMLGVIIILFSCLPCSYGLISIRPTIEYSQLTGTNYSLNVILPLLIAGGVSTIGILLVIATFVNRPKKNEG